MTNIEEVAVFPGYTEENEQQYDFLILRIFQMNASI